VSIKRELISEKKIGSRSVSAGQYILAPISSEPYDSLIIYLFMWERNKLAAIGGSLIEATLYKVKELGVGYSLWTRGNWKHRAARGCARSGERTHISLSGQGCWLCIIH